MVRLLASIGCVLIVTIATAGLPIGEWYLATALFSAFVLYLLVRPRLLDAIAILVLACGAVVLNFYAHISKMGFTWSLVGAAMGVATLLVVLLRMVWEEDAKQRYAIPVVLPSTALAVMVLISENSLRLSALFHSNTWDLYALSYDGSLGFQPSFAMGQAFQRVRGLEYASISAYATVLIAIAVAHLAVWKWRPANVSQLFMVQVFLVAGLAGYTIYQLFPVAGPVYAFGRLFPEHSPTFEQVKSLYLEPIPMRLDIARNGMPSLHMGWALAIWWNLRTFRKPVAWAAAVLALLTAMATIGIGEHYLCDLIVAFPFMVAVQAAVARHIAWERRVRPLVMASVLVAIWLVLLRYEPRVFWISPVIPWAAMIGTVAGSLYMAWPLTSFEAVPRVDELERAKSTAKA